MGPEACYRTLRSLAIAGEYLYAERPKERVSVSVSQGLAAGPAPAQGEASGEAMGEDRKDYEMLFRVKITSAVFAAKEGGAAASASPKVPIDMPCARNTNAGNAASALMRFLDDEGYQAVHLRAMGADAATQALKVSLFAHRHLEGREGEFLEFTPRLIKSFNGGPAEGRPKKTVEVVLQCRLAGAAQAS